MLIDNDGTKKGIIPLSDALSLAEQKELDLVQVSPSDAEVIVCKLLDYGKHHFEKKKNHSSSKVKIKKTSLKEIKFRPSTDIGD